MYGIYKTMVDDQHVTDATLADAISSAYLIDTETDWPTAVELARLFAHEHADRIGVTTADSGNLSEVTGATFATHNGTRVWYSAKPLRDTDRDSDRDSDRATND